MIRIFESNNAQEVADGVNNMCTKERAMITSQSLSSYVSKKEDGTEEVIYVLSVDMQPIPKISAIPAGIVGGGPGGMPIIR